MVGLFDASKVLVVAGKGGVGKTTVGATIGLAAARRGLDVLLVELEGRSHLGAAFGQPHLAYDDTELDRWSGGGRLRARQLTPNDALRDYLDTGGLHRLTSRLARSGAVEVVTAAAPGIRDLLVLGKIRQLEQRGEADLIVVDAPASGHALAFLMAPLGLARAVPSGPVRHQADLVLELFADEHRCQVVLVTWPEEGPVNEVVETAYSLEDQVGIRLGPVVVNGCWSAVPGLEQAVETRQRNGGTSGGNGDAEAAGRFRLARVEAQTAQIERLARELPLPQIRLPFQFSPRLERTDLEALADALTNELSAVAR